MNAPSNPAIPLWITHPACTRHEMGAGHPESIERLHAIQDRMNASGLLPMFRQATAPLAPREALVRVHEPKLVDWLLAARPNDGDYLRVDPDTALNPHSAEAARAAAGAVMLGVDELLAGHTRFAFCAVRPPGHHAERRRAMGFCLFNSIAVGAAHALASGCKRVAVVDFDVHYGNGTSDIFRDDPRVLVCNTYQDPYYPGWVTDPARVHIVDAPLKVGDGSAAFRAAVESRWAAAIDAHRPELILVSAGFDAHAADPLAGLDLRYDDYAWIGTRIRDWADAHARGRVVASLEGGYDTHALARSVEAFVRTATE
jgi:acetoin utilization deacetylase AcuC-like enzyme